MAATKMHGLRAVRLSEVPYEQRMSAARIVARTCRDEGETAELLLAAMFPSDKLYFVRAQAEGLRAA